MTCVDLKRSAPEAGGPRLGHRALTAVAAIALVVAGGACRDSGGTALVGNGSGNGAPGTPLLFATAGDIVGELEVVTPEVETFVLHGTLPVPKGTFPRPDGKTPLKVCDLEGTTYPAQLEIVSRYPCDEDGADVVEVLARVDRPTGAVPGQRLTYRLAFDPNDSAPLVVPPIVRSFVQTPKAALLRARDVFGNLYEADLLEGIRDDQGGAHVEVLKDGRVMRQVRTYHELLPVEPVGGPQGTLPHLMGVHAYVTQWAGEELLSLDLRVHNGHAGRDPQSPLDDPLGKVYFDELELRLPVGWSLGRTYPTPEDRPPVTEGGWITHTVVAPCDGGKMNMMPIQGQFHRRMALVHSGSETASRVILEQRGLAFCRPGQAPNGAPYWSWWNEETARYFPQKVKVPTFEHIGAAAIREHDRGYLTQHMTQMRTGAGDEYPVVSPRLGWAHPFGVKHGGMQGGEEIWLFDGLTTAWAASHDGYRNSELIHRMYTDRQPTALFESDGRPTTHDAWVRQGPHGPYQPAWMYMRPILDSADPFGFTTSPSFQREFVASTGKVPAYETDLLGFGPIDEEHLIRYTHSAKVLAWLGNDSLAKDDLRMQAENFIFSYNLVPQSSDGEWYIGTGMLWDSKYVDEFPGWGVMFGRSEGWGIDCVTAYYNLAKPDWRDRNRPWFDGILHVVEKGQSTCTGTITTTRMTHMFNGQYRNRQSIEACIAENALWEVAQGVYGDHQPEKTARLNVVLRKALYGMISAPIWSFEFGGPLNLFAVGPFDITQPPFCGPAPADGMPTGCDAFQVWPNFVYGYQLTGDPIFLQRADQLAQTRFNAPNAHSLIVAEGYENLSNRALLLGLLNDLAGGAP